jgi:vacuolar-type H+-ATPase subunit H
VPKQTPRAIIEEAKGRAKKIIEEAQAEAIRKKNGGRSISNRFTPKSKRRSRPIFP